MTSPRPTSLIRPGARLAPLTQLIALLVALLAAAPALPRTSPIPFEDPLGWPESQRAFLQDGPGFLLSEVQLQEFLALDTLDRESWLLAYLSADPIPSTPENELLAAIESRRRLIRERFDDAYQDVRAQLLFLHGEPDRRRLVDCAETFRPLEIWTYGTEKRTASHVVLYQERLDRPWIMWLPSSSKRVLYNEEMVYYLEQWEELKHRITGGKRIDRFFCEDDSEDLDDITGIDGLVGYERNRPDDAYFLRWTRSPDDLAAWARDAAGDAEVSLPEPLQGADLEILFPEQEGQRMVTRMRVVLPDVTQLEAFEEGESKEYRFVVQGSLESEGEVFEEFRVRFQVPFLEGLTGPLALSAERLLRPRQTFLLRLEVTEETTGKVARLSKGLEVASVATPIEDPPVAEEAIVAIDESLKKKRLGGADGLVLVPPISDVVFGLWRAEALVTGSAIERVKFLLDGKVQLSRRRPPFVAELRLDSYPKEQTIRAEGYDAEGNLVATDDIVLNQPRGELRVRIVDPKRGDKRTGAMTARVEVVVPEEKRVAKVELKVNEEVQAVLEQPPWEAQIEVPAFGELNYLTATAHLDDGLTAEDVRFLNSPQFVEEVNVDLVELFTTVTDRAGRIVYGLERGDFRVREDERPQNIVKFELVEDLPLTLGITIDTSGSMFESLGQAQRAAVDFLENIITPRDRTFAVAFSDQPEVLMQRTSDVGAVEARLESLVADGMTALHDAVVSSLYYYRGIRGRRALVLLSDGEDTASSLGFAESLEYARRSGVAIYTIGLRIGKADLTVRRKLDRLSGETGGRSFYIKEAEDLKDVYAEIERELRSQYLIAYNSDQDASQEAFRRVEVTVQDGKLEARTIGGYYP